MEPCELRVRYVTYDVVYFCIATARALTQDGRLWTQEQQHTSLAAAAKAVCLTGNSEPRARFCANLSVLVGVGK